MDFEDRRVGLEERFSGLSEGQRYALALVLNLAFVGVVIAGFALLYTTGFNSRPSTSAPVAEAPTAIRDAAAAPLPAASLARADTPVTLALPQESPLSPGQPLGEEGTDTPEGAPEGGPEIGAGGPLEAETSDPASGEETALAASLSTESAPEAVSEAPIRLASAEPPEPRLSPALGRAETAGVPVEDPVGALWATAGELTATLKRDFPCSQFVLEPGGDGRPALRARVGPTDDIRRVRTRVSEQLGDASDVDVGIGCTTVIGGGYVVLSDEDGAVTLLDGANLSREVRAVLPREDTCSAIGNVVTTQPALLQRLQVVGRPATWVRRGNEAALCEQDDGGAWRVAAAGSLTGRRAAVLVISEDVVATEARRSATLSPATGAAAASSAAAGSSSEGPLAALQTPPAVPRTAPASPTSSEEEPATTFEPPPPPANRDVVEVAPVDGPSPQLPAGVEPAPEGYSVAVEFTVDRNGRASDLSVIGAGGASFPVTTAALEVVQASRFPPATSGSYRATHTVRFPGAELMDLLTRLSVSSTEPAVEEVREAAPVWDRSLTQADYDRFYPQRALQRGVAGAVTLSCTIGFDGRLDCSVANEEPRNWGFAGAALSLASLMRAGPRMDDGAPSASEVVDLEFVFNAAD